MDGGVLLKLLSFAALLACGKNAKVYFFLVFLYESQQNIWKKLC